MTIDVHRIWEGRETICLNPACPLPDRAFVPENPNHRYCSESCRREHRYGWKTCPACGTEFIPRRRPDEEPTIYCSLACANRRDN